MKCNEHDKIKSETEQKWFLKILKIGSTSNVSLLTTDAVVKMSWKLCFRINQKYCIIGDYFKNPVFNNHEILDTDVGELKADILIC